MTVAAIKNKLHEYIDAADEKQLDALLHFVDGEVQEHWDYRSDDAFWDEMNKRMEDLESGKVKGVPREEVKNKIDALLKR